jgi:hypothetical protein
VSRVVFGRVRRSVHVRAPSTTETGTTAPTSRVTQMVAISSGRAEETDFPDRVSIRWTATASSLPGTRPPRSIRSVTGTETRWNTDRGPCETTSAISTVGVATMSNRWVQLQRRHRAVPERRPRRRALTAASRRMRWGVSSPQFSHIRVAACNRGGCRSVGGAADSSAVLSGPISYGGARYTDDASPGLATPGVSFG